MGLFFVYCSAIFELSILRNHLHNPLPRVTMQTPRTIENASRSFEREAFLTTWITTDARGTGGNEGSKEVTRVTENERKR